MARKRVAGARVWGGALAVLLTLGGAAKGETLPEPRPAQRDSDPPERDSGARADPPASLLRLMMLRVRFTRARASLQSLQTAVMMHYVKNGSWPTDADEMGLDLTSMYTRDISRIELASDGTIRAELAPAFGPGKHVTLQPERLPGRSELQWRCVSNLPEQVSEGSGAASCESRVIDALAPDDRREADERGDEPDPGPASPTRP